MSLRITSYGELRRGYRDGKLRVSGTIKKLAARKSRLIHKKLKEKGFSGPSDETIKAIRTIEGIRR